jgi:hypothetical protein
MERANGWIPQAYGYAVCLICVIIILVSTHSIIDSAFDYANPARSEMVMRYGPGYGVYESRAEEVTVGSSSVPLSNPAASGTAARKMYTPNRQEEIENARFRALRSLVSSIVFLLIATGMFLLHWRWIRRTTSEAAAA